MRTKRISRKQVIRELARENGWTLIRTAEWAQLAEAIPRLRTDDVRAAGIAAEPPWSGVRQHTLNELEASLLDLSKVYETEPSLRQFCRNEVIRSKDLARILSRARPDKAEMVQWMLVWLSDPALFSTWVTLRKRIIFPHQES